MSLRHAILGFLSFEPMSGYDLKRAFDSSVRNFWAADKAAIYRALAVLGQEGLVTVHHVVQHGRPDRHEQHLSDAGRAELQRWLVAETDAPPRREPFLLKLFFSDQLNDEAVGQLFDEELGRNARELATLRGILSSLAESPNATPRGPMLSLQAGLVTCEAWGDWLERVRAERLSPPTPGAEPS